MLGGDLSTVAQHLESQPHIALLQALTSTQPAVVPAQDDDAIIGWNLFNEPRCNCDPTVISQSGQITSEATGSDCGDVTTCAANIKVQLHSSGTLICCFCCLRSCKLLRYPQTPAKFSMGNGQAHQTQITASLPRSSSTANWPPGWPSEIHGHPGACRCTPTP